MPKSSRAIEILVLQGQQGLGGLIVVDDEGALGDLDLETARGEADLDQDRQDLLGEPGVLEVHRGDVDGDLDVVRPVAGAGAGLTQERGGQAREQPGLLGDRNEDAGRDLAARRMGPARQHLEAGQAARREIDDGLEMRGDLPGIDGRFERGLELGALADRLFHLRLEDGDRILALLGVLQGDVGAAHDHVDLGGAVGAAPEGDAGVGGDRQRRVEILEPHGDRGHQTGGAGLGGLDVRHGGQDVELVGADPRDEILGADRHGEAI
nr:hypothetical protein [Pinisolibacter aquiterrae]